MSGTIFHSAVSCSVPTCLYMFCCCCCWFQAHPGQKGCRVLFQLSLSLALCPSMWPILEKVSWAILLRLCEMFCRCLLSPLDVWHDLTPPFVCSALFSQMTCLLARGHPPSLYECQYVVLAVVLFLWWICVHVMTLLPYRLSAIKDSEIANLNKCFLWLKKSYYL